MKLILLTIISVFLSIQNAFTQSTSDYAVQLTAEVQSVPPLITLNWPIVSSTSYSVYRKLKSASAWGALYATLPGGANQFIDTNVSVGVSYEYKLVRTGSSFTGYGYINSGIEIPETDYRGKLILIVDNTFTSLCSTELSTLQSDLENEGWIVMRFDVYRTSPVDSVKSIIENAYQSDTTNVKSVFLLGHVPVPYSGLLNPDGHSNHYGAWPADVYYGDMNGNWTDVSANNSSASDPRNHNLPGDGKFDQTSIPSDLELQVGRVDFSNLPAFSSNEETLLRKYLHRDHDFRVKNFTSNNRAVIDDNFGAFGGEAFAASGFKNFAPLVGDSNVISADYLTTLDSGSYIWSYGCGGGSYTSCGGVGTTADFAADSIQTIFTMLFGSYFGDWDVSDNYMRAALASGTTLGICWSGRPHWVFTHMSLGENIGYDARVSQNNSSTYYANYPARDVHIAFLGDPSLRMHIISPPQNLTATTINQNFALLNWTPSADAVAGYNIYRRTDSLTPFVRVNSQVITDTTYTDSCLVDPGVYQYMVRAVRLETTPGGSYFNLSPGSADTTNITNDINVLSAFNYTISNDSLIITANNSLNATGYSWDFGDGGTSTDSLPHYYYSSAGNYVVTLMAYSSCDFDSSSQIISITTGLTENLPNAEIHIYPNPTKGHFYIISGDKLWDRLSVFSTDKMISDMYFTESAKREHDLSSFAPGIYFIRLISKNGDVYISKVVKY